MPRQPVPGLWRLAVVGDLEEAPPLSFPLAPQFSFPSLISSFPPLPPPLITSALLPHTLLHMRYSFALLYMTPSPPTTFLAFLPPHSSFRIHIHSGLILTGSFSQAHFTSFRRLLPPPHILLTLDLICTPAVIDSPPHPAMPAFTCLPATQPPLGAGPSLPTDTCSCLHSQPFAPACLPAQFTCPCLCPG